MSREAMPLTMADVLARMWKDSSASALDRGALCGSNEISDRWSGAKIGMLLLSPAR